jgi:ankyrin repeat protein
MDASLYGNFEIVKLLIENNADTNIQNEVFFYFLYIFLLITIIAYIAFIVKLLLIFIFISGLNFYLINIMFFII